MHFNKFVGGNAYPVFYIIQQINTSLVCLTQVIQRQNSSESQLFGKYKKHQQRNRKVIQGRGLACYHLVK